ncbi:MAG: undecaprenyldiphospho-muramoylpentapeptide beta-N-acetylglucosaminyltransferase [Pseudomonadota bacterium]|nr:undecaprenyldiphospho-muramoylpentapeptide beta-N-acetylglucosaminyltransferase [Pseudomonadota bacterium]
MTLDAPVMILAGGTGGHIFPGIAVARALQSQGVPVVWLGSRHGLENTLVPNAHLLLETIAVSGLRGKGGLALLAAPLRLMRATWQASRVVAKHRPRAALSFGGFAAGPGGLAARLRGVPIFVHEQNRVPGLTNRVLARIARRVFAGFPDAFAAGRSEWTGNPVRSEITALPPPAQRFAARGDSLRVLILGGSQGAAALNNIVPIALSQLRAFKPEIRHQCGTKLLDAARGAYAAAQVDASVEPFIEDMAAAYGWADLVICRSGALTLAELCAAGVASILVPLPSAADDHQTANARFLEEHGAALLMPQAQLTTGTLAANIRTLAEQPRLRLAMAEAARALAKPDAAVVVARRCLEALA